MTAVVPSSNDIVAACADCVTTLQSNLPGANANVMQTPSKWFRDAQGKLRFDYPDMSIINDPASKKSILLDHLKKEARFIEEPPIPTLPGGLPAMPQPPKMPEIPKAPDMNVQELGKRFIDGVEAEGKRYLMKVPPPPNMPQAPEPPNVMEVWTGVQNKLPILTMIKGKFGEQICHCKYSGLPPAPSMFEIPPDYKLVKDLPPTPQAPKMPEAPKLPSLPKAPKPPGFKLS